MSIMDVSPDPAIVSPGEDRSVRRIDAVRAFNRFYTRRIGVLEEGYLESPFSLVQARVLYELARRARPTAIEIASDLELDTGYLSRILRGFERSGLVIKSPSASDGRQKLLSLTTRGREAFAPLDSRSRAGTEAMLTRLSDTQQGRLVGAMSAITRLLDDENSAVPYLLRSHEPGDMGWVVQRHGVLYAAEYGWDQTFEALVAEIVADFIRHFDPERERCWIIERDGENVGSVFLMAHREREGVGQLRLLLVEPSARGLGLGRRLVDECTRFARQVGYHTVTLWTNDVLVSARRIYEAAGFQLVQEEQHQSFGQDLVGQTWEMRVLA
jgi:DNA-binding MarR family transcriptional regulator/GNAT superfamily N-acetyltransferase